MRLDGPGHGLIAIKAAGGLSLVRDPRQARYATMPLDTIQWDQVNTGLTVDDLAGALEGARRGKGKAGSRVAP